MILMKNLDNKGQALVEFAIILPIFMMLVFVVIDFANVYYQKNHLEGVLSDVVDYKKSGKSNQYIEDSFKDVSISYKDLGDTLRVRVSCDVNLVTPFSSLFFDDDYVISSERVIIYE